MSSPALKVAAQSVGVQPGSWPWAFQSPTMKPSKPIRPLSTPVSSDLLPCILAPFQLLYEAIAVIAPAATAGG
jgi:hypothetical protein